MAELILGVQLLMSGVGSPLMGCSQMLSNRHEGHDGDCGRTGETTTDVVWVAFEIMFTVMATNTKTGKAMAWLRMTLVGSGSQRW